jgi:hypothetical protein
LFDKTAMRIIPTMPYIYELIDPRSGDVFYVGKGRNKRAWEHISQSKSGKYQNKAKTDKILEILADGLEVQVNIVSYHETDLLAGDAEKARIEELGLSNLTNILAGGCGSLPNGDKTNWPKMLTETYDCIMRLKPPHLTSNPELAIQIRKWYCELYQQAYDKLGPVRSEWLLLNM